MTILERVRENEGLLTDMRRHLHEHPELSGRETETLLYVRQKLEQFGVRHTEVRHGGIVAEVGREGGRCVMLRADLDALPVPENDHNLKGPKGAVSKNAGVSHACGHDGHTAMLLVAAKVLQEMEDSLEGKVYLAFERGEEAGLNARYLLRHFEQNDIRFDAVYGTHLLSTFEGGKISVEPGGVMAGSVFYRITLTGRGGHGSRPDLAVNPIDCFHLFYSGLTALRMKYISPFETLTVS
ncbi:MAG: amidohydrolase, partial [Clostridiales bacterium]|nr:amidohydrolase [Clostridiales bacterium]